MLRFSFRKLIFFKQTSRWLSIEIGFYFFSILLKYIHLIHLRNVKPAKLVTFLFQISKFMLLERFSRRLKYLAYLSSLINSSFICALQHRGRAVKILCETLVSSGFGILLWSKLGSGLLPESGLGILLMILFVNDKNWQVCQDDCHVIPCSHLWWRYP